MIDSDLNEVKKKKKRVGATPEIIWGTFLVLALNNLLDVVAMELYLTDLIELIWTYVLNFHLLSLSSFLPDKP